MARIRTIKPEFWTSEQVSACSHSARLLFVGLWTFCDDAGVHPASVRRLKMQVFPGDSFDDSEMQKLIDELIAADLLDTFDADGKTWWHVTGWLRHQKIDRPNYKYPSPPDRRQFDERSTNDRRTVVEQLPPEPEPEPDNRKGTGNRNRRGIDDFGVRVLKSGKANNGERAPGTMTSDNKLYSQITDDTLKNPTKLLAWYQNATKAGLVSNTESERLNVFGAAERAVEHGRKPAALFVEIVKQKNWKLITNEQEDRARVKLKAVLHPSPARSKRRVEFADPEGEPVDAGVMHVSAGVGDFLTEGGPQT